MFLLKLSFRTVKTLLNLIFFFFLKAEITDFPFSTAMAGGRNQYKHCFWGVLIFITDISRCASWWLAGSFKAF